MRRQVAFVVLLLALIPRGARGQTVFEVSGGYNVVDYRGRNAMPIGWFASLTARPVDWFGVVSEFSAEFDTDNSRTRPVDRQAFAFLDGPRFLFTAPARLTLFGEALVGIAHDRDFVTERSGDNRFVWQPGLGVDARLSDRISARFQVGWRYGSCCGLGSPGAIRFISGFVVTTTAKELDEPIQPPPP